MTVYTRTQVTSDHGDRLGVKPSVIVLHHTAFVGSIQSLINLMMPGGRTVSAHAAIKDNDIVNVVPESRRSFSLGAAVFERRVLSAECVNSTGGPSWSLSDATHESVARWVADVCKRHDIRPHREGASASWTVISHREVSTIHREGYATACPGGMRVEWIVARAQQLMTTTPNKAQEEDERMKIIAPFGGDARAVIGPGIGHAFGDRGSYLHFCNVWGFNPETPQVVGDAAFGKDNALALFHQIVAMHTPPAAPGQLSAAAVTAAVASALAGASIPATVDLSAIVRAVGASLADDFARVNANVDEIPLGFTITAK